MTPAARVQAAIEILDLVFEAARNNGPPADKIVGDWFRGHRFAGSKDRRAVREHVYGAIRACGPVPESGRAAMLRLAQGDDAMTSLFDGSQYGPQPIGDGDKIAQGGVASRWVLDQLRRSGITDEEAAALLERAPLDIRINTLKADPDGLELPVPSVPACVPHGLRLPAGTQVEQWPQWLDGQIEVQDAGSQITCMAVAAQPGETIIDLCAGAGGKTLALAAAMDNRGTLIASDTDRGRLSKLEPRARRAGAAIAHTVLLNPGKEVAALEEWRGKADAVLVDAPCSGSGTWRRNPETRWRLSPKQLENYAALQARLLDIGALLVRPGGRLVYVVCSLLDAEGRGQMDAFLERHQGWKATVPDLPAGRAHGSGQRLSPHFDGTDGFFIARLSRM